MSKPPGGARRSKSTIRSIAVPNHINDAMLKHPDVNWSQIAAKAFHDELLRIQRNPGTCPYCRHPKG